MCAWIDVWKAPKVGFAPSVRLPSKLCGQEGLDLSWSLPAMDSIGHAYLTKPAKEARSQGVQRASAVEHTAVLGWWDTWTRPETPSPSTPVPRCGFSFWLSLSRILL